MGSAAQRSQAPHPFLLLLALLLLSLAASAQCPNGGLKGAYFPYSGTPTSIKTYPTTTPLLVRYENVNFDWGEGSPGTNVPVNDFVVHWTGFLIPKVTGQYTFQCSTDDGFMLKLGGTEIAALYADRAVATTESVAVTLTAGAAYPIWFAMYERGRYAVAKLWWKLPGSSTSVPVPLDVLSCDIGIYVSLNPIVVNDQTGPVTFEVKLTGAPNTTVTLSFSSCLPLSTCSAVIGPSNWTVPINITISTDSLSSFGTGISSCFFYVVGSNGKNATIPVTKTNKPGANSVSWGDPHFTTFDGAKHDFYEIGDYYYVRQLNSEFVIQTRQNKCASVSCNYGVAIKFRTSIFYVFLDSAGTTTTHSGGDPFAANGITITLTNRKYTLTTLTGIMVGITTTYWSSQAVYYLDLSVDIPAVLDQQIKGLAGFFDGNATNDYMAFDGTVYQKAQVLTFQRSWKVTASAENLFLNASAAIPAMPGAASVSAASLSSVIRCGVAQATTVGDITAAVPQNKTLPPALTNATVFDPSFVPSNGTFTNATVQQEANKTCTYHFVTGPLATACKALVKGDDYYTACMFDYAIAGDATFVASAVKAYAAECDSAGDKNGTKPAIDLSCPDFCSGQGNCTNGTCACNPGFLGTACETNTNLPPVLISVTAATWCNQTVSVTGRLFFLNTTITCRFTLGGLTLTSPATIVTEQLVTCRVPTMQAKDALSPVALSVLRGTAASNSLTLNYTRTCCDNPCPAQKGCTDVSSPRGFTCGCVSVSFSGFCYDGGFGQSTYCFNVTVLGSQGCNVGSVTVSTDCAGQIVSSSPPGLSLPGGFMWVANFTGTSQACLTLPGLRSKSLYSAVEANLSPTAPSVVGGPYCKRDECASSPCQNGGTCNDLVNGYNCTCAPGFSGKDCDRDIDECASNPCRNGGTCVDLVNGFRCTCTPDFNNTLCQDDINTCRSNNTCQNGGTCVNLVNANTCACPWNFTGATCQNLIPSLCANATLLSSLYDAVLDRTTVCYLLSTLNHSSCALLSFTLPTDCLSPITTTPAGVTTVDVSASGLGHAGLRWVGSPLLAPGSQRQACVTLSGAVTSSLRTAGLQILSLATKVLATPTCGPLPCLTNPCFNGGTFVAAGSSLACSCSPGYQGPQCETFVGGP